MKTKSGLIAVLAVLLSILAYAFDLHAGSGNVTVTHAPDSIKSLKAGWDWAMKAGESRNAGNGFYIGYSIKRMMGENSFIGSWSTDREDEKTLSEIIYGKKVEGSQFRYSRTTSEAARKALDDAREKKHSQKKVLKEVALIFRIEKGSMLADIKVSNIVLSARLKDAPLFWLGQPDDEASIEMLIGLYKDLGKGKSGKYSDDLDETKEDLVMAVAMHDNSSQRAFGFLEGVLTGKETDDIREKAAFWIGESQNPKGVNLLFRTANNDRSEDVREKAVFGLYLNRSKPADEALIELARKSKDRPARKKAIFWLGQKAVKRSAEVLNDVVENDKDNAIQKAAIFALSQLKDGTGVDSLIKIAKTHKNMGVRKKAIFWLSQSDDPRALDTIIKLIEN
jgi:HEAT repeat protein